MMQREVHLSPEDILNYIKVDKATLGHIALVSGQPHRARMCLERLKAPVKNFSFLGHTFWTGGYKGKKITVGNGGLYSPDSALVTELLCSAGVEILIRIGSCGALKEEIKVGDYILAEGSIRGDGVTSYYVGKNYQPLIDKDINLVLEKRFIKAGKVHKGPVWTTDALFRETREIVNSYIDKGAIAVDMVTSSFLTVASLYKKRCACVLAVSDNLITGRKGFVDKEFLKAEKNMVTKIFEVANEI